MFKTMSLKAKLLAGFATVALCLFVVGGLSYFYLKDVTAKYDHVVKINYGNYVALSTIREGAKEIRAIAFHLGMPSLTQDEVSSLQNTFTQIVANRDQIDKVYQDIPFVEGEQALYDAQIAKWKPFLASAEKLMAMSKNRSTTDLETFAKTLSSEFTPAADAFLKELQVLIDFQNSESAKWSKQAEETGTRANLLSLTVVISGFTLALIIGLVLSDRLARRLNGLAETLSDGANQVAASSHQVAVAGVELSNGSTQQAAALQETVSAVEEISAMVKKNAENAKKSQEVSRNSQSAVDLGLQTINEMIAAVGEINKNNVEVTNQMTHIQQEVSNILKVISEIGDKTKVINDIVFQTKLLSFNASVEAARAGEHGKGFAVVAEEVGNLAQMSGNAAKEISSMLEGSMQQVNRIVEETKNKVEHLIQSGREKVESGTTTAQRCGEVLNDIVKNVSQVGQMVEEIAQASQEQAHGIGEINKAMNLLDHSTQKNAHACTEASQAADHLDGQANKLREAVTSLFETVQGTRSRSDQMFRPRPEKPENHQVPLAA